MLGVLLTTAMRQPRASAFDLLLVRDEVRYLVPDVAIAHKLAYATDEDGNDLEADHAMDRPVRTGADR